jgi:hypothetical protein
MSIVLHSIISFARIPGQQAIVLVHPEDSLYERYQPIFKVIRKIATVIDDIPGICRTIDTITSKIEAGERKPLLVSVLGYELLCDEFSMLPKKADENAQKKGSGNAILDMMADFGLSTGAEESGSNDISNGYDARDDLTLIASRGCRYGVHVVLSLEKTKEMQKNRQLKMDLFNHRISTPIAADESLDFFGSSQAAKGLDSISAAYSDSGATPQVFRPYLLPQMKRRKKRKPSS